jgi:hypothetical protein
MPHGRWSLSLRRCFSNETIHKPCTATIPRQVSNVAPSSWINRYELVELASTRTWRSFGETKVQCYRSYCGSQQSPTITCLYQGNHLLSPHSESLITPVFVSEPLSTLVTFSNYFILLMFIGLNKFTYEGF